MGGSQVRSKNRRQGTLSSAEAAAALGVCERTLRRYIEADRIRYHRLPGGHYRIPAEAIAEFWSEHDRRKQARRSQRVAARRALAASECATAGTRRPALGREDDEEYDLSDAHLVEIRERLAATPSY